MVRGNKGVPLIRCAPAPDVSKGSGVEWREVLRESYARVSLDRCALKLSLHTGWHCLEKHCALSCFSHCGGNLH